MAGEDEVHPKVFISYSHDSPEHAESVLELSDQLRSDGIDGILDQYEDSPAEGFPRWMDRQILTADFVLMICTSTYFRRVMGEEEPGKGLGVQWESSAIYQYIYNGGTMNTRFIPVLLESATINDIPVPWQGAKYYRPTTKDGYEDLYRRLTNQPYTPKGELGKLRQMPPRKRKHDFSVDMQGVRSPGIIDNRRPERPPLFTEQEPIPQNPPETLMTTGVADLTQGQAIGRQTGLQLTEQQRVLYETLVDMDKQLSTIYLGALTVLADEQNPDRLALTAHGFRELVEKLPRYLDAPVKDPPSMKVKVQLVHESWKRVVKNSACYEGTVWTREIDWSGNIDGHLQRLLKQMGEFFQWFENERPSRKQQTSIILNKLGTRSLPKSLQELQVEAWERCHYYFDAVAHHSTTSLGELEQWVAEFEHILLDHLDRLQPRTTKDEMKIKRALEAQEKIRRIIVEGEANA